MFDCDLKTYMEKDIAKRRCSVSYRKDRRVLIRRCILERVEHPHETWKEWQRVISGPPLPNNKNRATLGTYSYLVSIDKEIWRDDTVPRELKRHLTTKEIQIVLDAVKLGFPITIFDYAKGFSFGFSIHNKEATQVLFSASTFHFKNSYFESKDNYLRAKEALYEFLAPYIFHKDNICAIGTARKIPVPVRVERHKNRLGKHICIYIRYRLR